MIYGLDLFSGIGGLTLALSEWVKPVAYCENDRYAQGVLLSRQQSGALPLAPIWDDVRTLSGSMVPAVDIIYGGFPCQDISTAGNGKGLAGERSGLFFHVERLVGDIKPRFVFLENVPAIRTRGGDVVAARLAKLGYDCRWGVLSASDVGATHKRERWFLLACRVGNPYYEGPRTLGEVSQRKAPDTGRRTRWDTEPGICRVANGVPARVDRIKTLGNAVVPEQAREAFVTLLFGKRDTNA